MQIHSHPDPSYPSLTSWEERERQKSGKCENDTKKLSETDRDRDPAQIAFTDLPHWIPATRR